MISPRHCAFALATFLGLLPGSSRAELVPPAVEAALAEASAVPGARLVAAEYRPNLPSGCAVTAASLGRPIEGSGRYAVKLSGAGCGGWAWVRVQVWAPVPITTRAVKEGELLGPALDLVEKEIAPGRVPPQVAPTATAARPLPRGQLVQAAHVRDGAPAAGQPVKVVVQVGSLLVEQTGRTVSCGRSRACAVLPSGKHVEGRLEDGRLYVEGY
jgi:hypothetical protein